jgi:aspartate aminotransferase-like enzyme
MKRISKPLLMIPGPSEPYPDALSILASKVMAHYGEEWIKIYNKILEKLKLLFGTKQRVYIYLGPATGVIEMGINSVIKPNDNVLIINKGFFIDRFKWIAEMYGAKTHQIAPDNYGDRVDLNELEKAVKRLSPKIIIMVHSETSTGLLEDIDTISTLIPRDSFFFVDAVSSFGAMELHCDKWNIDLCAGYASKALGAINGVVPFMVSERLWDHVDPEKRSPKGFMNDLGTWRMYIEKWGKTHPYPISIPSPLIIALDTALDIVLDEGIKNVEKRHYRIARIVHEYIDNLGLELIPKEEYASPTVSAIMLPKEIDARVVMRRMEKDFGIMVSSTWLIKVNGVRIGHMGYTAQEKFVIPTLYALEKIIAEYH